MAVGALCPDRRRGGVGRQAASLVVVWRLLTLVLRERRIGRTVLALVGESCSFSADGGERWGFNARCA